MSHPQTGEKNPFDHSQTQTKAIGIIKAAKICRRTSCSEPGPLGDGRVKGKPGARRSRRAAEHFQLTSVNRSNWRSRLHANDPWQPAWRVAWPWCRGSGSASLVLRYRNGGQGFQNPGTVEILHRDVELQPTGRHDQFRAGPAVAKCPAQATIALGRVDQPLKLTPAHGLFRCLAPD